MSDSDDTKVNLPKPDLTRRGAFTLAAAIAAFGAGLGMRSAAGQTGFIKLDRTDGKAEHKIPKTGKAELKSRKGDVKKDTKGQGQSFQKFHLDKK